MRTIAVMFNGKCRYTVEAPESCSYVDLVRIVELHPLFSKYKKPIMGLRVKGDVVYYKTYYSSPPNKSSEVICLYGKL